MKTRSGKVLLPAAPPRPLPRAQAQAQAQPQPLRAQPTLSQLEVTPSATGQGTHTRWIRGDSSSPGASPVSDAASNESANAPVITTTAAGPTMSTPGQPTSFDLSAYITPEPWVPTSPPRPSPFSPLSRGGPHARSTRHTSQYSTDVSPYPSSLSRLRAGEGEDDTPSANRHGDGDRPRLNALGSAAHERLQVSLANGARADRPRGRPLVGPTGTFVQTPRPFDVNAPAANSANLKPADEFDGVKAYPPLPQLVCGSPLGSPYSSQEENFNFTLKGQVKGSARSRSPTRRRCVK